MGSRHAQARIDKHVVGSFQLHGTQTIKAVALPGYRFAKDTDSDWTYLG